ncbi:HPr family phosphocarrier protein [Anaeromicropila populeti]|uniref:Phosphocarrier protein n=1 Tax=Anaeromicropila populeti TaxID=37658 RepID=A0A1I6J208_9FIRM|nr:HPr family phosphocarrier protein [Anaeromicropila populeti]SFR73055.1 phosphocarrier protein [Anaeromicropila populeti]
MRQFSYRITGQEGVHAKLAGLLVKMAMTFTSDISIGKKNNFVDAKRIFGIMSLEIKYNEEITIKIDGEDEEIAFKALQVFFNENL